MCSLAPNFFLYSFFLSYVLFPYEIWVVKQWLSVIYSSTVLYSGTLIFSAKMKSFHFLFPQPIILSPSLIFQMVDILFGMRPNQAYRSFLFLLFCSVHLGPRDRPIGLSDSRDPTCLSGLSQPATHSATQSFIQSVFPPLPTLLR